MKRMIFLMAFLLPLAISAQTIEGSLAEYRLPAMDLIIMPFGIDNPVKIGAVDEKGNFIINLDDIDLSNISEEKKAIFWGRLSECLFCKCADPSAIDDSSPTIEALNAGNIFLWYKNSLAGTIYMMSDERLRPWLEEQTSNDPVTGSFFNIVYVNNQTVLDTTCNTVYILEKGDINPEYTFNLSLKAGFNLVEYTIEKIYKTAPGEMTSIPLRVSVTTYKSSIPIKYVAKYF